MAQLKVFIKEKETNKIIISYVIFKDDSGNDNVNITFPISINSKDMDIRLECFKISLEDSLEIYKKDLSENVKLDIVMTWDKGV